jgi:5'-methylthioadenosine phosphorylase
MSDGVPAADLLILVAVYLPPSSLDVLGPLVEEQTVHTPYGAVGPLGRRAFGQEAGVWVQPYTGVPTRTDPRATILAAQALGIRQVLVWDTAIGLNHLLRRGEMAVVADYIDWTRRQPVAFSGGHLAMQPAGGFGRRPAFCPRMSGALSQVLRGAPEVVYLGVDGPRRETAAEARMYHAWGADVLGTNLVPEVELAHEAGLCFAGLVTVSELSADRPEPLPHGELRAVLGAALQLLPSIVQRLSEPGECDCRSEVS